MQSFLGTLPFILAIATASAQGSVVSVETFDGRDAASQGDVLVYSIVLRNASSTVATVSFGDLLPSNVLFLSASDGGIEQGTSVTWSKLTLAPSSTRSVQLRVWISPTTPDGTLLTNTVQIAGGPVATDATIVGAAAQGQVALAGDTTDSTVSPISSPSSSSDSWQGQDQSQDQQGYAYPPILPRTGAGDLTKPLESGGTFIRRFQAGSNPGIGPIILWAAALVLAGNFARMAARRFSR